MSKRSLASVLMAGTLIASLTMLAIPASAGPPIQCTGDATNAPDGKMNADGGPFVGAGDYPETLIDIGGVVNGDQVVFLLKWKNVSGATRTIRVDDATDFTRSDDTARKIFVGGVNVTRQIRQDGQLKFADVPPGTRVTIEVILKNRASEARFTGFRLRGRYGGSPITTCDELTPVIND
jgi:hypothetical protein